LIFKNLEEKRRRIGTLSLALIDPDLKNDNNLGRILENINKSEFDAILVGGSSIQDNKFEERIKIIKSSTDLPVIIFPGGAAQISSNADAILFTSLISGRNPRFLIEEQVKSSLRIYNSSLEVIPTGYILLKTDKKSAVEIVSNTSPLPMDDLPSILSHALAAQYLGKKILFLEAGSNSNYPANEGLIKEISSVLDIPIIVGGGIKKKEDAKKISKSGASYIVIGSLLEESIDHLELLDINNAVHS
jgi:putative glycerol-1-phosphate prenyltransferase